MRPLRVLHAVEASFAGVGRHVLDLAHGQIKRGLEVDLVYGTPRVEPRFEDQLATMALGRTHPVAGQGGSLDLAGVRAVDAAADRGGYDIVHGHASRAGAWVRLARSRGARRVYTPNALITQSPTTGRLAHRTYGTLERLLARRTDGLIHVSPEEARHAEEMGLRPRHRTVIANGIPLDPLPDRAAARAALGLPADRLVVGFVGRLAAQKGIDLLVDVAPALADAGALVAIVGDGPDRAELVRRAGTSPARDAIRWLGPHPGQEIMPAFDVFALPSRYEGFPYVMLEALWAGVPVVATAASCAGAALGDGRAGTIVERDQEAFAAAVLDLLGEDDRAARRAVAQETARSFSVDAMVESTIDFYRRILA